MREVTIIGAGPGGSVAAILLARRSWRVVLVEQHRFPREKVCGECLSAAGAEVLERLGLMGRLRALGAVPLRRAVLHGRSGAAAVLPLPREMWGISRPALDGMLLEAARSAGALIEQPARCEAIRGRGASRLSVRVRRLIDNSTICIESDRVLLADGRGALLAARPPAAGDFGIQAHFEAVEGTDDQAIELFAVDGHYGGVCRIENGLWNVAFSVPGGWLKRWGDLDRLFEGLMGENRALARRMSGARRARRWLAAPLGRFGVRRGWPAGVIPIGNAAAAIEPIGGEGMGLAMQSAEVAAGALETGTNEGAVRRQFQLLWRRRRLACGAALWFISSPAALRVIARRPSLQRLMWRWMGKG